MLSKKIDSHWFIPVLAWCVYAAAYFCRINLSITIPYLQNELGFSKTALGFLASGFFIAYAAGQLINGIIGDRLPVRYFISLGLIVAGVSNIIFGMIQTFPLMLIAWTANGYFQSMLWGPLLRTLSEHVPPAKQDRAKFMMSTSPVVGSFFAYILAGRLAISFGWKAAFLVPGIILLAMAGIWFCSLSGFSGKKGSTSTPGKDSLKNEGQGVKENRESWHGKLRLVEFILHSRIYLIIILGIFIGISGQGLSLWSPSLFTEYFSLDMNRMLSIMSLMPLVNLLFIITGGILFKNYLKNENRIIILFLSIALLSTLFMWRLQNIVFILYVIIFYVLMASITTANIFITGYVPFKYKQNGRVSAAAGIIDSSIYLGAAIAGPVIGAAAERFGWDGIFGGILGICVLALIPCFLISKPPRFFRNRQAQAGKNNNPPPSDPS